MQLKKLFTGKKEKGSLALEQILFIGAIVVMSGGIFAFYGEISDYFSTFKTVNAQTNFGENPNSTINK